MADQDATDSNVHFHPLKATCIVSSIRGSTHSMCVFWLCLTCVSMQRRVRSRQGGGRAGCHYQALPVARPTAEDRNQTQFSGFSQFKLTSALISTHQSP